MDARVAKTINFNSLDNAILSGSKLQGDHNAKQALLHEQRRRKRKRENRRKKENYLIIGKVCKPFANKFHVGFQVKLQTNWSVRQKKIL